MLTIIDGTFSWALECLRTKLLNKVRRKGWPKGIYIRATFRDPQEKILSYIYIVYPDGSEGLFDPSQRDLVEKGWEEYYDAENN